MKTKTIFLLIAWFPLAWVISLVFILASTPLSDTYEFTEALTGALIMGSVIALPVTLVVGVIVFLAYAKGKIDSNN